MAEVLLIVAGIGCIIVLIGFFSRKANLQPTNNKTPMPADKITQTPHAATETTPTPSITKTIPLSASKNLQETQILSTAPSTNDDKTKVIHSSNMPSPKLKIQSSNHSFVFTIHQLPIAIGKSPNADLCIDDKELSDFHANILLEDGFLYIEDSGSSSGVWIENKPIQKSKLTENQIITIGNTTITFIYE